MLIGLGLLAAVVVVVVLFIRGLEHIPEGYEGVRPAGGGRFSLYESGWFFTNPLGGKIIVYPVGDKDYRYPEKEGERVVFKDGRDAEVYFTFRIRIPSGSAMDLYNYFGEEFENKLGDIFQDAVEIQAAKITSSAHARSPGDYEMAVEEDVRDVFLSTPLSLLSVKIESWNLLEGEGTFVAADVAREPVRKILFIGVDGADWIIINALLEKGKLPNLKKIIEGGATGPLRSIEPLLSPLIWTTMATGKLPEEHGVLNFTVEDPETGEKIPITRMSRKADAFWNMMSDYGRSVDIIGWLATYPAEKINGTMVTDRVGYLAFASPEESGAPPPAAVYPPEHIDKIAGLLVNSTEVPFEEVERIIHIDQQTFDENKKMAFDPKNPVNNFILIYATASSYFKISKHLYDSDRPDFFGVYFEIVDAVGHLFMPFAPPKRGDVSDEDYRKFKDAVDETYVFQDRIIGELLERIDDNTVVMIVSDHGFKSGDARLKASAEIWGGHAAQWHRLSGIICLYGRGIRPGFKIRNASVIDIAPTILALAGFPRVEDMPGKILADAFEPSLQEALNPTTVATLGRDRGDQPVGEEMSGVLDQAQLKKLEALGYLTAENPDALDNLGQRYQKQGQFEKAIVEYKKALALRPNFASALNNIGICYGQLKRYPEAERSFKKALEINPEDMFAMNNLAVMYLTTGRFEEARRFGEMAISIEPKYTNAHITLGSVYATIGKYELAEKEFRTALEIEPDNRSALDNLRRLQQQKQGLQ